MPQLLLAKILACRADFLLGFMPLLPVLRHACMLCMPALPYHGTTGPPSLWRNAASGQVGTLQVPHRPNVTWAAAVPLVLMPCNKDSQALRAVGLMVGLAVSSGVTLDLALNSLTMRCLTFFKYSHDDTLSCHS